MVTSWSRLNSVRRLIVAIACGGVALAVAVGSQILWPRTTIEAPLGEWINPGAALAPDDYIVADWFDRGSDAPTSTMGLSDLASAAGYPLLVRVDASGAPIEPIGIIVQPNQLVRDSSTYCGFTFRYADRFVLVANPSSAPLDIPEAIDSTVMKTTKARTQLNTRASARGRAGVHGAAATQKWESGQVNSIPALLEWSEPVLAPGDVRYVTYTLMGDVSLEQLQAMADSLRAP